MLNKLALFLTDTDSIAYCLLAISLNNIHEVLSLFGLAVSISYSVMKIKKDFFK